MHRRNTVTDALNTGEADLDLGDGLSSRVPLGKLFNIFAGKNDPMLRDTGERDITALLPILTAGTTGRKVYLRRSGNTVSLTVDNLSAVGSGTLSTPNALPVGFRPAARWAYGQAAPVFDSKIEGIGINGFGTVQIFNATDGDSVRCTLNWFTSNAFPDTYPGTAA